MAPVARREFIKISGLGSALLLVGVTPMMAGPFTDGDLSEHLILTDKKLSPKWIASLTERGKPELLIGGHLAYVGMPIGGIGCGQLYLGGDGRLWLWDIFKSNYGREEHEMKLSAMTMGGLYPYPVAFGEEYNYQNGAEVEQGFAIRVESGENSVVRILDKNGFPDVTSRGKYPVDKVTYQDDDYGVAFKEESGGIGYRGRSKQKAADDGQAGTILRACREHQMSDDDAFLKRLWPRVKKSIKYLIAKDTDRDGVLNGAQPHTLRC